MGLIVFLLFVTVPIVEIGIFISVGERFGLWPTIAAVIATAVVGTALLRHQGLQTLARAHKAMNENRPPVAEVFEGACLVIAGALLLTPGFLTDAVGFALMLPPVRASIVGFVVRRVAVRVQTMHASGYAAAGPGPGPGPRPGPQSGPRPGPRGGGPVIDGEFEEVDQDPPTEPAADPGAPPKDRLPPTSDQR
jgi:UPF0716 protein FxsA